MVLEINSLQYTMYKADNAQNIQNLFVMQDRASQETYSNASQNAARADQIQVHQTEHAEGSTIKDNDDSREPFGDSGGGNEKQAGEEEKEKKEPSPDGKGRMVDFQA